MVFMLKQDILCLLLSFFIVGVQGEIVVHILPPAPDHAFRARHSGIVDSDANIRQ